MAAAPATGSRERTVGSRRNTAGCRPLFPSSVTRQSR